MTSLYFHWSSEIYGLGTCYRRIARYPKFLPLFFTSDHGVSTNKRMRNYSIEPKPISLFHLTWTSWIVDKENEWETARGVIKIKHPYFLAKPKPKENKRINFIYYPTHDVPGFQISGAEDEDLINRFQQAQIDINDLAVSIFASDSRDYMSQFKNLFPTVSAGAKMDPDFFDNLFSIIKNCETIVSQNLGSHVFFGLALGKKIIFLNTELQFFKDGQVAYQSEDDAEIFRIISKGEYIEDECVISTLLDDWLGMNSNYSRIKIFLVVWSSLLLVGLPFFFTRFWDWIVRRIDLGFR